MFLVRQRRLVNRIIPALLSAHSMEGWLSQTIPVRVGNVEVLVEVAPVAGSQPTSAAGRATENLAGTFDRAQDAIEEIAVSAARMIGRVAKRAARPEQVELEFGVKFSAKGDVIVAGAAAEASWKVKIIYGKGPIAGSTDEGSTPEQAP